MAFITEVFNGFAPFCFYFGIGNIGEDVIRPKKHVILRAQPEESFVRSFAFSQDDKFGVSGG
jgi:hypothetical protein